MVAELITAGTNVNDRNQFGDTALHHAVRTGSPAIVVALLQAGANVNARQQPSQDTPLHLSVIHDQLDVMNVLIRHGADKHAVNSRGHDYRALAWQRRSVQIYAALNPSNPHLPPLKTSSNVNKSPLKILRAMTASPPPEKQEQARVRRSSRFASIGYPVAESVIKPLEGEEKTIERTEE